MRGVNALAPTLPRRSASRRSFAEVAADHLDAVHRHLLMLTADPQTRLLDHPEPASPSK